MGQALPLSLAPAAQQQAGRCLSGEHCPRLAPRVGAGRLQRTPRSSPLPPRVGRAVAIRSHAPSESLLQRGPGIEGYSESQGCSAAACSAHLLPRCRTAAWAPLAHRSLGFILEKISASTGWGKERKARSPVSLCTGHSRERETEALGKDGAQPLPGAGLGSPCASAPWHTAREVVPAPTLKLGSLPHLTHLPYHINQNPIFSPLF